jgi:hypothetical protein
VTLFRNLGFALAISFATGLVLAFATGTPNLLLKAFAISGAFASGFCGFALGEHIRKRGKGQGRLALLLLTVAAGVLFFSWGLVTPPVIGQSESQILFPGFMLIGVLAGMFARRG